MRPVGKQRGNGFLQAAGGVARVEEERLDLGEEIRVAGASGIEIRGALRLGKGERVVEDLIEITHACAAGLASLLRRKDSAVVS